MIFVGLDWSEGHHDVDVRDDGGQQLASRRVDHGVEGMAELHALIGLHVDDPTEVAVGIETDRGLLVASLVAAGYLVYAINPRAVDRYRDRHGVSGAKSDARDTMVLAELVRTDRHHHRLVAGDSDDVEGLKTLTRGHQSLIWARTRHVLQLRHLLLEYYPAMIDAGGGHVGTRDVLAVLAAAPTPSEGAALSAARIKMLLRRAGRCRNLDSTAERMREALRSPSLQAAPQVSSACAVNVAALVAVIAALNEQIEALEIELTARFTDHNDAVIIKSMPGLGAILGARVLAEFGDDPDRYVDAKARRNYAGTSPITRASGKSSVVVARSVRNDRLADACDRWAFATLSSSPGARRYYDECRAAGKTHGQALRALSNRLVGILHGCLRHRCNYDETIAWVRYQSQLA